MLSLSHISRLLMESYMGTGRPGIYTAAQTRMNGCIRDVGSEMLGDSVAKRVAQMPFPAKLQSTYLGTD